MRNKLLSSLAVLVLVVVVFVGYEMVKTTSLKQACIEKLIQKESTLTIYLGKGTKPEATQSFQAQLLQTQQFVNVTNVTAEQVEATYRQTHTDPLVLQALDRLGPNQFGPYLLAQVQDLATIDTAQKLEDISSSVKTLAGESGVTIASINALLASPTEKQIEDIKSYTPLLGTWSFFGLERDKSYNLEYCANKMTLAS